MNDTLLPCSINRVCLRVFAFPSTNRRKSSPFNHWLYLSAIAALNGPLTIGKRFNRAAFSLPREESI
jgi:hypothetical protein